MVHTKTLIFRTFVPLHAGDAASRVSTGGSSRADGFQNQNSPTWDATLLDFQLALRAVHGLAIRNRLMGGKHGLRDVEQIIDHERRGIGLLGEANLGCAKLCHAFGVTSSGFISPNDK